MDKELYNKVTIFKVYSKLTEYIILKCPNCNHIFRKDTTLSKNVKCQKCEKSFVTEGNSLDYDPLYYNYSGYDILRQEVKGNKQIKIYKLKKLPIVLPKIKVGDNIENE